MKKIFFLILLFLFPYSFSSLRADSLPHQSHQLLILNRLDSKDKSFIHFSQLIKLNNDSWERIKRKFSISKVSQIKPLSVALYYTKKGDNVFSIAEKLGLNSDTIISFNSLSSKVSLLPGQQILIPSMDGVLIFPSNSTESARIARVYNIPESLLLYTNSINSRVINKKEEIFIPFARMSDEEKAYFLAKPFVYPLDGGVFSSPYGKRFHPIKHKWLFHGGVDIATPLKSRVYASAKGTVIFTGVAGGYGNLVVLKHKYGYTTFYGHLSSINVKKGQEVSQREFIALSGNTGQSTGPHLHFEIRRFNLRTNPMEVLSFNHHVIPTEGKILD